MIDTKKFNLLNDDNYKKQTQKHWGKDPCGAVGIRKGIEPLSKEYFDDLERVKDEAEPWKRKHLQHLHVKGKEVLEIGYGMGTDHLALARMGGNMHGIDITPGNKEISQKRLEIYGFHSELLIGDAENLPYEDNTFDIVYTFGVIHHTPNMDKAVKEIYRVLKPGGQCYIGVYHKNSLYFWWSLLICDYIMKRQFLQYTLKEKLSLVEYPCNNTNLVVKLSTKRDMKKMLADFKKVKMMVSPIMIDEVRYAKKIGEKRMRKLFPNGGWYLIVRAKK